MATSNTLFGNKFSISALADSVTERATKGVLILVLDDATVAPKLYTYKKLKEVVENYDAKNKGYITTAFSDYKVRKVIVAVGHDGSQGITGSLDDTLALLSKVRVNGYMAVPQVTNERDKKKVADFIKTQRNDEDYPLKGVISNYTSDSEGITNFTGNNLGIDEYTSDEYCLDVACMKCTLGANENLTNHIAKKVKSCDVKVDADASVANGELFLINNGTNIVFSNDVNSLTTIPNGQNEFLTHARVVEVLDLVKEDINEICNRTITGKMGNSYSNRRTVVANLCKYLKSLRGYLSNDDLSYAELDLEATKEYLDSINFDYSEMDDETILKQKIGTNVFIKVTLYVMDIMEHINFNIKYQI